MYAPFLASSVPDLSFDRFMLNDESSCLKLDANRRLRVQTELIPREPRENLGFSDGGVADQHHLEHVVYSLTGVAVTTGRHCRSDKENAEISNFSPTKTCISVDLQ